MEIISRQTPGDPPVHKASRYLRRSWATISAALVTLLVLAACTGAAVNDQPATNGGVDSGDTAVNQPISQVEIVPAESDQGGSPQIIDFDNLT
ncbi:MAG: hypothetical protein ACE5Q6_00975, partial [Dehalococcoidia bacterium]